MLHLLLSRHHLSGLAVTLVLAVSSALPAIAKDAHPHVETQGVFSEVIQDLQDAIINRGFVVDFVGHVDTMLNRTSDASKSVTETGSRSPFLNAKYVQFCSAKLTLEAVEESLREGRRPDDGDRQGSHRQVTASREPRSRA